MSTLDRQLIRKPQSFYRTVHEQLGFQEKGPRVLRDTDIQCPILYDKEWDFGAKFKKMEEFFRACENTTQIDQKSIDNFNMSIQESQESLDRAFIDLNRLLNHELVTKGYAKYVASIQNPRDSGGVLQLQSSDGQELEFPYATSIVGGFQNAFALILGFARIIPEKLLNHSRKKFKDFNDFKETVKQITRKNIYLILGFSKLEMGLFFKLLNILGDNHRQRKLHHFYDINSDYFDFDKKKNPTQLLPFKSLSNDLIEQTRTNPSALAYGTNQDIEKSFPAISCPAIYIRTQDGTKNMIEFYHELICDVLDKTIFENLDKWFQLKSA